MDRRHLTPAAVAAMALPLVWASVSGKSLKVNRFALDAPSRPILGGEVIFNSCDAGPRRETLHG